MSCLFNLPLKTASNTKGVYTEDELYAVLTLIYTTIFLDVDPVKTFPLRQATKTVAEQLGKLIETSVGVATGWFGGSDKTEGVAAHGSNLIKSLSKSGMSASDIAWEQILPSAVAMVPTQGTVVSNITLPTWPPHFSSKHHSNAFELVISSRVSANF